GARRGARRSAHDRRLRAGGALDQAGPGAGRRGQRGLGPLVLDMPRVLVVTPTYNERDNLPDLVAAVHRAAPEAEVLVVDDASPDGTGAVADALAAADPRVRVRHR